LSSQNDEISLQKYLPISGKLLITNNLKQNDVDHRSHLTVENNLKVEKKVYYCISKTSTTLRPTKQKRLGYAYSRRDKHTKNWKAIIMLALCLEGVYCITRALKMVRQYFSTSQRET